MLWLDSMIHAKVVNHKSPGHWTLRSTPKLSIIKVRRWTLRSMPKSWIIKVRGVGLYDPHQRCGLYKSGALDSTIHAKVVNCTNSGVLDSMIHAKVMDGKSPGHWTLRSTPKSLIILTLINVWDSNSDLALYSPNIFPQFWILTLTLTIHVLYWSQTSQLSLTCGCNCKSITISKLDRVTFELEFLGEVHSESIRSSSGVFPPAP